MTQPEKPHPAVRLRETLRRNAELVEALPAWARAAMAVDVTLKVPSSASGDALCEARANAGLSQRELAERLGVSHVFIGAMERGEKRVPSALVSKLLACLPSLDASVLRAAAELPASKKLRVSEGSDLVLVLAFLRKARRGFSPSEVAALWEILRE